MAKENEMMRTLIKDALLNFKEQEWIEKEKRLLEQLKAYQDKEEEQKKNAAQGADDSKNGKQTKIFKDQAT